MSAPAPWIIEGVAVVRGLRKWVAGHDTGAPADVLFIGQTPRVERTSRQSAMGLGFDTIWSEIAADVLARGMTVTLF